MAFAQQNADVQAPAIPNTVPTAPAAASVNLDGCIAASLTGAPGLKTAKLNLDTASSQLTYAVGSNGLTLGESVGDSYQWPVGSASSTSSSAAR